MNLLVKKLGQELRIIGLAMIISGGPIFGMASGCIGPSLRGKDKALESAVKTQGEKVEGLRILVREYGKWGSNSKEAEELRVSLQTATKELGGLVSSKGYQMIRRTYLFNPIINLICAEAIGLGVLGLGYVLQRDTRTRERS